MGECAVAAEAAREGSEVGGIDVNVCEEHRVVGSEEGFKAGIVDEAIE